MPAGFNIDGKTFFGTNGAVESYIEAMADEAASRFGGDDPLAVFFRQAHRGYFTGMIVFLDPMLPDAASKERFVELLDAATRELLRRNVFTESGREWVATRIAELRRHVATDAGAG